MLGYDENNLLNKKAFKKKSIFWEHELLNKAK